MKLIKSGLILAITTAIVWSLTGYQAAAATTCLDASELVALRSEIEFDVSSTGVPSRDLCDPSSHFYKTFETLNLLKSIEFNPRPFTSRMNQSLFGSSAHAFWAYLQKQGLRKLTESQDPICKTKSLYGYTEPSSPGTIYLCSLFFDKSVSIPDRMVLLLHESRHFDDHPHVSCRHGIWKGLEGGCDNSIRDGGSYAVSTEAMARLALLGKNVSKAARENAKVLALAYAQTRFNKPVLPRGSRAVYITTDNSAYFFDGKNFYPAPFFAGARAVSRETLVDIFPARHENAFRLELYTGADQAATAYSSSNDKIKSVIEQYNSMAANIRPYLIDILSIGNILCYLQPLTLDCRTASGKKIAIPLLITAASALTPEEFGRPLKNGLYILDEEGTTQRIQLKSDGTYSMSQTQNTLEDIRTVVVLRGVRYGLRTSGELIYNRTGTWQPVVTAQQARFRSMTRSFYWSVDLIGNKN